MSSLVRSIALDRAPAPARLQGLAGTCTTAAFRATLALVVLAPFERAIAALPGGFTMTSVEMAILAALAAGAVGLAARPAVVWPRTLLWPGALFLVILGVATLAAPVAPGHAARFTGRMLAAALICLLIVNVADRRDRARTLVWTLVAVAALVGAIAVLEAAQVAAVMNGLTWFRPGFHVVGGQLRATGPLVYPTIASMYLEVAFAFGLWLLLDPGSPRPRVERAAAFVALAVIGAGISATFTRAGLIGMAAALALVAVVRMARFGRRRAGLASIGALAAALVAIVVVSHSPELLAARLTTDGSRPWYGATYDAPATLQLETGRVSDIAIAVTNTGRLTWDSTREPPFTMSYHWLRAGSDRVVVFEGRRTRFPHAVTPGGRVVLPVSVRAPGEPGTYVLVWDGVHETRAWFSTEGVEPARTAVVVIGARAGTPPAEMDRLPSASPRASRPELWAAALGMAADRPWLGVGPDNFRHVSGAYLGGERWDPRIHANNMYLEILAGAGVAGLFALVWLVAASGLALVRRCRTAPPHALMPAAAALAAWLLIAGHGLVDSFLGFTTTYVMFAVAAGLACSPAFTTDDSCASPSTGRR